MFKDLIVIEKSGKIPKEGDIFILQPLKGKFYCGKVIKTNIKSRDSFVNGMVLVYIYNMVLMTWIAIRF